MRAALVSIACLALVASAHAEPEQTLLSATDELLREVSALRGLRAKIPVVKGVLSRDQIGDKLRTRIDEDYSAAEVGAEARVLVRMGLLPIGVDYRKLLLDVLMEQVQGFYDPKTKRLYIADWIPLEEQRPTLTHELEHVLQDQTFGLLPLTRPLKEDGDRQLAHSALVEGDASAVTLELAAQTMRVPAEQLPDLIATLGDRLRQGGRTPLLDHAPLFVRETLIFPYLEGLKFVATLRRGKPWKRIDDVFRSPPESTEQILHPDRYLSGDAPIAISAAPLTTLAPRKQLRSDVLGELALRTLFRSRLPEPEADSAAAGWGGDRLVAYASGDAAPVVLDLSVWDTVLDAQDAAKAFASLFGKITGSRGTDGKFSDPNGETWRVERREDRVLVEIGGPKDDAAVVAEAWAKLRPVEGR